MARIFKIVLLVLALLPGATVCAEVLRLQAKADELYHDGHWERAYFIYVNDLAAIGDKYSQYMAGYMSLHGKGVKTDKIGASAWYRLAAERGNPKFSKVRNELMATLSDAEKALSDTAFVELRRRFGDLALTFARLKEERGTLLEAPTGSRLASAASSILIIEPQSGTPISRAEYMRRQEERMQIRLDYIAERLGLEELDPHMSDTEFDRLGQQVEDYLQVVDDS